MHPVEVEVVLLRAGPARSLAFRLARAALPAGGAPDAAARQLADADGAVAVLHSTSWRHEDGRLVLTYAALPDPRPDLPCRPLRQAAVLASGDPAEPSPPELRTEHVVAHAARHLAFVAAQDPAVADAASADPTGLWAAVRAVGAATPTVTVGRPRVPVD